MEPKEHASDGFWRKGWESEKEAQLGNRYDGVKAQFQKHIEIEGPTGSASPTGGYNPNPGK